MNPIRRIFQQDARHFQIACLSIFLSYGLLFLDWEADLIRFLVAIFTCLLVQTYWIHKTGKNYRALKSALISALSLCLLLKTNLLFTTIVAASITISSKFLLHKNGKHIFNPANIGIITCLLITEDAWISPGQWGSDWLFWIFLGLAGLMMVWKVGRVDTSLAFLSTFFVLEFSRNILYKGWPLDFLSHQFSNGTLLLFTFFMITDPMTTPNAPKARLIWASLIGFISFILSSWFYVYAAPIWALFLVTPFTPFFDTAFGGKQYEWQPKTAIG